MPTWRATKAFLNKTWETIKKYWKYLLAVAYGVGMWLFFRGKTERVKDVLDITKESHKKQIDKIEEINEQEIENRDKLIVEHSKILQGIEEKYAEENKKLSARKKKEIKKMVEEHGDNPGELAKLLGKEYGFLYVHSAEID
jgi:uncharacterized protein HemX|tara:strand:- start:900 stop:1322 length:423 start_codon:yes stop_codon:yes gene_type:complete